MCQLLKRAVCRRDGYPIGVPAPCYLTCQCGKTLDVPRPFTDERVQCPCGQAYDSFGWLKIRPE